MQDALRLRNGPDVTDIHKVLLRSHVLVYCVHRDEWDGPFPLIDSHDETCTVLYKDVMKDFHSTIAKQCHHPSRPSTNNEFIQESHHNNSSKYDFYCPCGYRYCFDFIQYTFKPASNELQRQPTKRRKRIDRAWEYQKNRQILCSGT